MIYSLTQLAQGRGSVLVRAITPPVTHNGRPGQIDTLQVDHFQHGETVQTTTIERVPDENPRDTRSRAIAAVRMLGYWPELRREIHAERFRTIADIPTPKTATTPRSTLRDRLLKSGLILPPGAEQ